MGKISNLFVVATPIGNMGDITFRAVDVLRTVDFIAAEDTRVTKKILQRYGISTPVKSYHDFSSEEDREKILSSLLKGNSIALVSDAGTPLVSDPGYKLVNMARSLNIRVEPVPGACSVIAALCVSGLATIVFSLMVSFQQKLYPKKTTLNLFCFKSAVWSFLSQNTEY